MSITYGLTSTGFVVKPMAQIVTEITQSFQSVFGQNVNLSAESNLGNLMNIFAEREALIWQLAQAVYSSQFPSGAEGTSVDNILALNNLRRLAASPTKTAQLSVTEANGITLYPLVLYGTPGTTIPAGSTVQTSSSPPIQFTTDQAITIASAVNAIQGVYYSNTPNSGALSLSIEDSYGNTLSTASIAYNAQAASTSLLISTTPVASSSFKLILTQAGAALTTAAISTNAAYPTASAIQSAITALSGYSGVTVSGSSGSYVISWGSICNPVTTVTSNTTGATISSIDSFQSAINSLYDSSEMLFPYTDATVSVGASGFNVNFGQLAPLGSNPSSGAQPQALMTVNTNTLMLNSNVTNVQIATSTVGSAAQGTGTATCTVAGPNFVAANSINTIGTPITGWSGVVNQLDCITGTSTEDDTQALVRRQNELNAQANGPLLAIIDKVSQVTNVTQTIGFQNLNEAALQVFTFGNIPSSGSYQLMINGNLTSAIAYNAVASAIQTAVQALPGLSNALVSGNQSSGFTIDFNGSLGGQPISLMNIVNNTTSETITPAYGRPGKSVEMVVQGGDDTDIATAILASKPAGIQTYGNTGPISVFDSAGNQYSIYFSRATQVPIYVSVALTTDTYNVPGNPGSGLNPNALFSPSSIQAIQQDIVTTGNATPIGGTVIGFGTNGLIGCFDSIPGIVFYTLYFGTSPNPTQNTNISLLSEQVAVFETFNVAASYI